MEYLREKDSPRNIPSKKQERKSSFSLQCEIGVGDDMAQAPDTPGRDMARMHAEIQASHRLSGTGYPVETDFRFVLS
jgi:hypothetical protein